MERDREIGRIRESMQRSLSAAFSIAIDSSNADILLYKCFN